MLEQEYRADRSLSRAAMLSFAVASVLFRLIHARFLANITPVGALGLFGGSRLRSRLASFAVLLGVMVISDVLLYRIYGDHPFNWFVYACYGLNVVWGWLFLKKITAVRVGGMSLLSSVQFFLITNFGVWMNYHGMAGGYESNLPGLMMCYVEGVPFFFRTLLGDVGFSALFFGLYVWASSMQRSTASLPSSAAITVQHTGVVKETV
jgi:hypothetical protein